MVWNFDDFRNNTAAALEDGSVLSYGDLEHASIKLVEQIPRRCLTFILCNNQIGALLGYISLLNHKIVPFMVDAGLSRELFDPLLATYKPDFLWCPEGLVDSFSDFRAIYVAFGFALLKTDWTRVYPLDDELALLLTTSGSTGSPKLVRQSYSNIHANTVSIVECLDIKENERAITTLPMSYTYGLSILNTHLYAGASVVLTEKSLMQREFWQQCKALKVTSFGGVPYTYEMLDKLRFFRMDLPDLRMMTQAGGKLSPHLQQKFAEDALEKDRKFVVMYGQTEATARMSYLPPEQTLQKSGSIGIAIPGGRFSLISSDGMDISAPELVGELVFSGDNVTLGYAEMGEDLARGNERKGILVTGDMAKRDVDGYYYIVGRKKRFLKIFGSRINLDEVEAMLKNDFSSMECACSGEDDKMHVFITDSNQSEEVKKILVDKIGLSKRAFILQCIETIPKNESGKILYTKLHSSQ